MVKSFVYATRLFHAQDKKNTVFYLMTSILSVPLLLAELFITKYLIEIIQNINITFSYQYTFKMVILMVAILYANGLNSSLRAISSTNLMEISLFALERDILQKTSQLSLEDLEWPETKTLREKARSLSLFNFLDQWVSFITNIILVISLMAILIYYKVFILVIFIVVVLIFQLTSNRWITKKIAEIRFNQTTTNRVSTYLFNLLVNRETIQEVRTYKMFGYLKEKMQGIFIKNHRETHKKVIVSESITFSQNIILAVLSGLSVTIVVVSLGQTGQGAGLFVLLLQISNQLFTFLPRIATLYTELTGSGLKYVEYMNYKNLEEESTLVSASPLNSTGMRIEIKGLSFQYRGNDSLTLNNINLTILPGDNVAFVGDNGSGKSTLIKIILGLYKPTHGEINWYSDEIELLPRDVSDQARVVFQDYTKLLRSVRENIAMGNINELENDQSLHAALLKAKAPEHINNLDMLIGPEFGGRDLSGGQWQRLAISRAYLKEASLTIFDEPTASLDPQAELKAFEAFVNLGASQTSIIVTHRLSMSRFVDKVFLFENGAIIEAGSHKELMELNGKYKTMYDKQSSLYD